MLADLNDRLKSYGLMFPPDPSTGTRCHIGGMIGNNAWGAHAPIYGTTRDWVVAITAVLSDGSSATFNALADNALQEKIRTETIEGRLYRCLDEILKHHRDLILESYPTSRGIPSNAGYALDVLAGQQPWSCDGAAVNLAPFLCGSEGTLAIVTEATLKLAPLPKAKRLLCIHFAGMDEALEAVTVIAQAKPAAVELLDDSILSLTTGSLSQKHNCFWIEGTPKAVLLVEFYADNATQLTERTEAMITKLQAAGIGYAYPQVEGSALEQVWELRRAGLGLLMNLPAERQAVTGIEDTAVALVNLAAYAREIKNIVNHFGTECVMYGSVAMGLIHFRPFFDLRRLEHRKRYSELMIAVAECVQRYRGTCSAKHGDGRLRAHLLKYTLGEEILGLLRRIKATCDPQNILNPGKIFDAPDILTDLRATLDKSSLTQTGFDWNTEEGFDRAASRCQGAGACLQGPVRGTMCPSYQATQSELYSPRGRSSLLSAALLGRTETAPLNSELESTLSLCLSCKACKRECPASVDVAKLKAEMQHQRHIQSGIPWRTQVMSRFELLCRLGSLAPRSANRLLSSNTFKRIANIHKNRSLPAFASQRFSHWFSTHVENKRARSPVLLLLDPFVEYFEPQIGQCAVALLEAFGFNVRIIPLQSSLRLQISLGLLDRARKTAATLLQHLQSLIEVEVPLIGLEPSEILTLRDEFLDLIPSGAQRDYARRLKYRSFTLEDFLGKVCQPNIAELYGQNRSTTKAVVHLHCHEKSLLGDEVARSLFLQIPALATEILKTGCCGMAGIFGYQTENYALSRQIAGLSLRPALQTITSDTIVVANGASCRQQLHHLCGIKALHSAELLYSLLKSP